MAQTQAQLLAAAKKQLAKTQAKLEAQEAASAPAARVNTNTLEGIRAASKVAPTPDPQITADDKWAREKL